jgi:hypothetical protein
MTGNGGITHVTKIGSALVVRDNVVTTSGMVPSGVTASEKLVSVVTPSGMPPLGMILLRRIICVMGNGSRISKPAIRNNAQPSRTSVVTPNGMPPNTVTVNGTSVSETRLSGKAAGLLIKRPVIRKTGRTNPGNVVMCLVKLIRRPIYNGRVKIASNVVRLPANQNNAMTPSVVTGNGVILLGKIIRVMTVLMPPSGKRWLCRSNGNRHVIGVPLSGTCRCVTMCLRPHTTPRTPVLLRRVQAAKTAW